MTFRFERLIAVACVLGGIVFAAGGAQAHGHVRHHRVHHVARVHHKVRIRYVQKLPPLQAAVSPDLVTTARRFLGAHNPTGFAGAWCGAFLNLVARLTGHASPPGYLRAAAWAHAGQRLSGPQPGAVAVYSHHVGIIEAVTSRGPLLISGNWAHRVGEGYQRRGRLLGYVALWRK